MTKQKAPRRVIHFANGDTLDEYSTDEEEETQQELTKTSIETSKLSWGPYFWFRMAQLTRATLHTCDYLGERVTNLLGLNSPKYQYAIDEYYRTQNEGSEDEDGEEVTEMQECSQSHEKQYLPLQNVKYGTIHQNTSVEDINEVAQHGIQNTDYVAEE
ncbi:protein FAM177B-like isoform X1 [Acipenser oxyrinchus oxyrinchus]|uniref:Protein FAM177B-like isoform X1 n=1 Tax=Acipenser oxyrinchus oxyrinchus TaxID=40147 RepID=A0AAD8GAK5_ACIOX|nr:protein FAM177B-like isoform X1 [Acipenser oxyrinchus oxyrinchus]